MTDKKIEKPAFAKLFLRGGKKAEKTPASDASSTTTEKTNENKKGEETSDKKTTLTTNEQKMLKEQGKGGDDKEDYKVTLKSKGILKVDQDVDMENQRHDKMNPLFNEDEVTFEHFNKEYGLDKKILMAIAEKKWKYPSRIQLMTIPPILTLKKNLVVQSQSGTGKTGCFSVALLSAVDPAIMAPQAILVSPTNELSQQNYNVVCALNKHLGRVVYPVRPGEENHQANKSQILISTPGVMVGMIRRRKINLKDVKLFILDEADELIEGDGNSDEMFKQLEKIKQTLKRSRKGKPLRTLLFSATFKEEGEETTKEDEQKGLELNSFVQNFVDKPYKEFLIPKQNLTLDNMKQYYAKCNGLRGKLKFMEDVYEELNVGQTMVFVNTRRTGENVKDSLERQGLSISFLHGKLSKEERRELFDEFVTGNSKVLLATNVLSRGIDVRSVTHVVNFDVPLLHPHDENNADTANYLHRVGRTARFGTKGIAINLVGSTKEQNALQQIEQHFKIKIESITMEELVDEEDA